MGLVFMGAIVVPVYLVPALTAVLALGLTAEARLRIKRRRAASARRPAQAPRRASCPALAAAPGLGPATAGPHSRERIMTAVLAPPATTIVTPAGSRWDDACQEPTVASVWQAAASSTIGDELLEWPPDLFALTEVILQRSEAYRFALSPPAGSNLATGRRSGLARCGHRCGPAVVRLGRGPERGDPWPPGPGVGSRPRASRDPARASWQRHATGELCEALLTLHAIADEACAGLGIALDASSADGCVYRARARELLARTGSLARIPAHLIRVLPKVRTPPNGSSVRALSRYAP